MDDDLSHGQARLATGRTYHYIDQQPGHTDQRVATLLCLHGFPDFWYGWRHQIRPWVAAGYRVVAPDMLGYGKTDMPLEASAYSTKQLCDDLVALLDHLGVQKAVVIGHDWGSFIAGRFALWYPERLLALALLSIPFSPPSTDHVSVQELARRYPPFAYQIYYASEQSTAEIEARLPAFFRLVFVACDRKSSVSILREFQEHLLGGTRLDGSVISDKELEHYISNFRQKGMIGPLSYYRTTKVRFEEERDAALPPKLRSDLPVLFLYGSEDATCSPATAQKSENFIDRLKVIQLPGIGHWVMAEASQTVTDEILQWLSSILGTKSYL